MNETPREVSHALQRRPVGLRAGLRSHRFFLRPRSFCLRLRALRRSGLQVRASQLAVGDAPSDNTRERTHEPFPVVALALIEAAHLLVNIPEQVERVNADVGPFDRPLEQRPEVFEAIGVDLPAHIFSRVIDRLMLVKLGEVSLPILHGGVGVEVRPLLHGRQDVPANSALVEILGERRPHTARLPVLPALQEAQYGGLVHAAGPTNHAVALGPMHELGLAADECLIGLDVPPHLRPGASLHGKPDAMEHEPTGLLSDVERPRQFVGADAVLAVRQHPQRGEPLVEPNGAILKDRPELDRELPSAIAALPDAAGFEEAGIRRFAGGATDALRPTQRREEGQRDIGVREVADGLGQRIGQVFGFHAPNVL